MYLDCADSATIVRYQPLGILKGITTNPTLLKRQGGRRGVTDIGECTIPEDFRNKRIHRCWQIDKT